jgi:tryptophan synthase beta chain
MTTSFDSDTYKSLPDKHGFYGDYGGRFVAETLIAALDELESTHKKLQSDKGFQKLVEQDLRDYVGRPTPLYEARRLGEYCGGADIWLKREDLAHTGAHKINNAVGQVRMAQHMGKTRVIAETGAGQHGVAVASAAARMGLRCHIYMGELDMHRQAINVQRMRLEGAEVRAVSSGTRVLKDALNEALRDWVSNVDDTFYIIGSVAGPHPYPRLVKDFQMVIGREARIQACERMGKLPDALVACVGGGSNAIGLFAPFMADNTVRMYGVEAGGLGLDGGRHAAPLAAGKPGVLHGNRTYLMQDTDGQILETHSISAGMDYPGVGPEHSWLHDSGRVSYVTVDDKDAIAAFKNIARLEGIVAALESSHALSYAMRLAKELGKGSNVLVNLSGRGDKDLATVLAEQTD